MPKTWLLALSLAACMFAMPQQLVPARLSLRHLAGQARDRMRDVIPGIRLELDTETAPPRLLAIVVTDTDGKFDFGTKIPPGDYRLVATYPGLCTANIPIEINPKASRRQLALRMEYPGLDVCSYAVLK